MLTSSLRLDRRLCVGGMSTVWVARHLTLQANVAVKRLSPELLECEVAAVRFAQEAQIAAQIDSPYVIRTYDYGMSDEGEPYIVMELLEGEDLHVRRTRTPRLALSVVERIVRHLAQALSSTHSRGTIHRDVKPANVFLVDQGTEVFVKLIDFGVAKHIGVQSIDVTSPGGPVGTPHYMSPEQLLDDPTMDHRTDLWSMAVVAFGALTGRRPFRGETQRALEQSILCDEPPRASSFVPGLPPQLDDWFARALHRQPDRRFATATEMATALTALCSEFPGDHKEGEAPLPPTDSPSTAPTPTLQPTRRLGCAQPAQTALP